MADKKISALPPASTPLAGTEVLPIVQGGITEQVSVANLTAGRNVSVAGLTTTGNVALATTISPWSGVEAFEMDAIALLNGSANYSQIVHNAYVGSGGWTYKNTGFAYRIQMGQDGIEFFSAASGTAGTAISWVAAATVTSAANIAPAAGKGIDFSANTHAAGMTSELLNWYEEGNWTPDQGGGLVVTGAFSSSGKYTRIGRQVTVSGVLTGATSIACNATGIMCTNLPFNATPDMAGSYFNAALTAGGVVSATANFVVSVGGAIAATTSIYFTVTYFV